MCDRSSSSSSSSARAHHHQRRKRPSGACGALGNLRRLELTAALIVSYLSMGKLSGTAVEAFLVLPPRTASNTRVQSQQQQDVEGISLEVARKLITHEATGSRRVTKKALLESIGYGVMDPLAYQTFENSPLPPKLRPTTHARIAEGIHSFGQEFLGVPPEEGVSLFSELAAPATADARRAATPAAGAGSPHFELRPKLPGVGIRMTVLRLANGELLVHSPVAPTVELLDMLRNAFPAVGPTTKVHLFSASMSPEHWAFLKHWKEIFPSAEVWAVPGPHRRLMGVKVDHDIEQISGVPERLGGEVEVAVLEGVPMVREALLLHRPTGTVLSADLLLAMDKNTSHTQGLSGGAEERQGPSSPSSTPPSSSPLSPRGGPLLSQPRAQPKRFGDHSSNSPAAEIETVPVPGLEEDAAAKGGGRWRRLRWGLLDRTASLLDMNTLSVFAPVKALLHAFKGNSAVFSSRVLSWEVTKLVACHGQSPLEGPELKPMLHTALGRYLGSPKDRGEKKKLGSRLLALVPGQKDGQDTAEEGGPENPMAIPTTFELDQEDRLSAGASYPTDASGGGGAGVIGGDGWAGGSFGPAAASVSRQEERPRPAETGAGTGAAGAGDSGSQVAASGVSGTSMSETEARARKYLQEKAEVAKHSRPGRRTAAGTVADEGVGGIPQSPPGATASAFARPSGVSQAGGQASRAQAKGAVDAEGSSKGRGNPFVVGPDSRYDERPAGSVSTTSGDDDDDPFEAPFSPFEDDGPQPNGRPPLQ